MSMDLNKLRRSFLSQENGFGWQNQPLRRIWANWVHLSICMILQWRHLICHLVCTPGYYSCLLQTLHFPFLLLLFIRVSRVSSKRQLSLCLFSLPNLFRLFCSTRSLPQIEESFKRKKEKKKDYKKCHFSCNTYLPSERESRWNNQDSVGLQVSVHSKWGLGYFATRLKTRSLAYFEWTLSGSHLLLEISRTWQNDSKVSF